MAKSKRPFGEVKKVKVEVPVVAVEAVPTTPAPMDVNIIKDGFDTGVAKAKK